MSISIYYTSTSALTPGQADILRAGASAANRGRSWLSSEPVHFFPSLQDGKLLGGSKPNFSPHPDDAKSAASSGLPDGTPRDLIEILCRLSREHGVDWELSHDFGTLGFIRGGIPDPGLLDQVDAFAGLGDALGELDDEAFA
jgi:hypothetical protein